ncbi:MAG: prepilin-type N-terminal cleavage/methylation domain-containing protein, partial [Pseudomonadales bacterium]|nr:prepilin-type N-terminal cleavage/methylation domain-containing protein [Pseudomonadales bacterium]
MTANRIRIPSSRRTGLTLVELLVTFVILSLLVGLVLEGLSLFTARYETVTRHFRTAASQTLGQQWFATSVRGIVPYSLSARRFQGDGASFTG